MAVQPTARAARPAGRPFYGNAWLWLALVLVAVLIGFWPSFFARPAQNALPHLVHGTVCTGWLLLLIVQATLVRARKLAWHRALGKTGYVMLPMVIVTGAWVLHLMLAGQTRLPPPLPLVLGYIDFGTLVFLAVAFTLAIVHRRNVQLHARWMMTTAIVVLPPALSRGVFLLHPEATLDLALGTSYGVLLVATTVLIVNDWRGGRLWAPYLVLCAYLAATYATLGSAPQWPAWRWLAARIAGQ